MYGSYQPFVSQQLQDISQAGTYKRERIIVTPQGSTIRVSDGKPVLNLCANNYLGLAQHPEVREAAREALDRWGYGMASVRFICGTQSVHKQLEERLSDFLGTEDTILYSSCFDANGGLFETLLHEHDAIISDALNHASIIDGIRLCRAHRQRYANGDMHDLDAKLQAAAGVRFRMIATDGVFSMDGSIAKLPEIAALAEKHQALLMVDDSHAVGFVGARGRGTHEHHGVMDRVDVLTGTLGKALGGASGGYTSGRREIIELLRQRSRPYLFSNTLCPSIAGATLKVLDMLSQSTELRDRLERNTRFFRDGLAQIGMRVLPGTHPICPVMIGDAALAVKAADAMLQKGVYVIGFSYPVVPKGEARIRTQISAAHTQAELEL
jgi:glycine C-acetyltransferase